jgi:hypothetical protein
MRLKPKIVVRRNVVNQSSRGGVKPRLIVLHSTESTNIPGSASDLAAVAGWFDNPGADASSHVITDSDGHSARCVADKMKAWSCVNFNAPSLNVEQIGHASQGAWVDAELDETARWIAHWHRKFNIPIKRGKVSGINVVDAGVVMHSELGVAGGGHTDPGTHYPLGEVLKRATAINDQLKRKAK